MSTIHLVSRTRPAIYKPVEVAAFIGFFVWCARPPAQRGRTAWRARGRVACGRCACVRVPPAATLQPTPGARHTPRRAPPAPARARPAGARRAAPARAQPTPAGSRAARARRRALINPSKPYP